MKTVAIVPAAGSGKRLGLKTPKPFVLLGGKPLVIRALEALDSSGSIDAIIVAAEKRYVKRLEALVGRYRLKKVAAVIAGGRTRFNSVKNCLEKIGRSFDVVLIHDGARPFVDEDLIEASVRLARKFGACIVAVPESDTVKLVDKKGFIRKTLDRKEIFRAGTPQAFKLDIIRKAYTSAKSGNVTDDSSLVESLGVKVKILNGSYRNIKITTKEDLKMGEALS